MLFRSTSLQDVYIVELQPDHDERGFFARTYSADEFASRYLSTNIAQCSLSFNPIRGTFRGLHFQVAPYEETKLVRCTQGSLYDIALDLRRDSPTYCQWTAETLTCENRLAMYIPDGCAHGFLTLEDNTEIFYQVSTCYHAEAASGVRWNDPTFGIILPLNPSVIAPRDLSFRDFVK